VARATHGQIPQLLPNGAIDAGTRLVLTDAEYLEAHPGRRALLTTPARTAEGTQFRRRSGS
jgi:hypothetical protein